MTNTKKAQVTVFIIIGIVILVLMGLVYSLKEIDFSAGNNAKRFGDVNTYVETCLKSASSEGLFIVGIQGGELEPANKLDAGFANISIKPQIDRSLFESEVSAYTEQRLTECLDGFLAFKGIYNITSSPPKVTTIVSNSSALITLDMPINISDQSKRGRLSKFSAEHMIRAGWMIDLSNRMLSDGCYDYRLIMGTDLNTYLLKFPDNRDVIVIEDNTKTLNSESYDIAFVIQR